MPPLPLERRLCSWLQLLLSLGWERSSVHDVGLGSQLQAVHGILILSAPSGLTGTLSLKQQNLEKEHEGVAMGCFKNPSSLKETEVAQSCQSL